MRWQVAHTLFRRAQVPPHLRRANQLQATHGHMINAGLEQARPTKSAWQHNKHARTHTPACMNTAACTERHEPHSQKWRGALNCRQWKRAASVALQGSVVRPTNAAHKQCRSPSLAGPSHPSFSSTFVRVPPFLVLLHAAHARKAFGAQSAQQRVAAPPKPGVKCHSQARPCCDDAAVA
jgi:hypothetical protein